MGSSEVLLYTPAIPVILRSLAERPEGKDESEFEAHGSGEQYMAKAVRVLLEHGLIERGEGTLGLTKKPECLEKVKCLLAFYEEVQGKARIELTFRGILNATQYRCLVHLNTFMEMMIREGFDTDDVSQMLAREESGGHVEHIKIMYRLGRGNKHRYFRFIPFYYYPHFIVTNSDSTDNLRSKLEAAGISSVEEDYLLGAYPKEMANQAREYIVLQKAHIKERIKNEAFDICRYYRF